MMEHSSLGRSGHFVFRGSDLWCQLGLILNYWQEFPIWRSWTFNASRRNQKNSEMQRSRRPEAWYAKESNKLNKTFAKFVLTEAINRFQCFPGKDPIVLNFAGICNFVFLCACDGDCDCLHHFPSCLILVRSWLQGAVSVWCSFSNILNVILLFCFAKPAMCMGTKT